MSDLRFDTQRIHAGYDPDDHRDSVSTPIYQTAAFDLSDPDRARRLWTKEEPGNIYSRIGNPTVEVLEQRIADLDGGSAAIALGSGMSAVTFAILLLGEGGGNIVSGSSLYGATQEALRHFYPKFGISTRFVEDRSDPNAYEQLIDDDTKAVYIESISNPNVELVDVDAIAEVAHRHGVPLIVDNTVATPYLFRPFEHGADIIVYSATKGIAGHGNVVAGLVVENGTFAYDRDRYPQLYERTYKLRDVAGNFRSVVDINPRTPITTALRLVYLGFIGAKLSPFEAYLVLQGLTTISERLDRQTANTERIVRYLETNSHVRKLNYAGASSSPYHTLAKRDFPRGVGSLLSFELDGGLDEVKTFITALRVFSYHVNIGDVRSLVANPAGTTHTVLPPDVQELAGIPANLIRLSIGLEDPDDLIEDLQQAFAKTYGR